MNCLFFGDSITEGSNCNVRFTYFLPPDWEVTNLGYSGTTIGEYSIYPVDGHSLLKQIEKHTDDIRNADRIFIEYGANDVSAIMCGFATIQTVTVSFVKAIDWIKQINPNCKITFLKYGNEDYMIDHAKRMCNYLQNDYFKNFNFKFPVGVYADTYYQLSCNISHICDTIDMVTDVMNDKDWISDDNIHPNELGHKLIALNIVNQCRA